MTSYQRSIAIMGLSRTLWHDRRDSG